MSYKYTDEKIPERPDQGGRSGGSSSRAQKWTSKSFRDLVEEDDAWFDDDLVGSNHSRHDLSGEPLSGTVSGSSRWDFVTVDELLYGNRRNRYKAEGLGLNETFRELLDMISDYQVTDTGRAEAFHKQARFMESYEASPSEIKEARYQSGSYHHLYIGYQEMDLRELREYFTWRTLIRQRKDVMYRSGFATLYAAELVSLGAEDPESTFQKLLELQATVTRQLKEQRRETVYVSRTEEKTISDIIRDFVIFWGPDAELVQEYCVDNVMQEEESIILCSIESASDLSMIRMIQKLVEGRVSNSNFFLETGEDAWRVVARVFRRMCKEQKEAGRESLAEQILGDKEMRKHVMYDSLPCMAKREDRYYIEVSPVTAYNFEYGRWYRYSYSTLRDPEALRELKALVRECERVLRRKMHYRNQLPNKLKDPRLEKLISEEYDRWMQEKERRNRPEIHVDLSKLDSIRDQADLTRDRLLEGIPDSDEQLSERNPEESGKNPETAGRAARPLSDGLEFVRDDMEAGSNRSETAMGGLTSVHDDIGSAGNNAEAAPDTSGPEFSESRIFTPGQMKFLQMLLDGEDTAGYLKKLKVMPSVFVDEINEAAFDEIGDSIVEEDGRDWRLVEDYVEDVRELL